MEAFYQDYQGLILYSFVAIALFVNVMKKEDCHFKEVVIIYFLASFFWPLILLDMVGDYLVSAEEPKS